MGNGRGIEHGLEHGTSIERGAGDCQNVTRICACAKRACQMSVLASVPSAQLACDVSPRSNLHAHADTHTSAHSCLSLVLQHSYSLTRYSQAVQSNANSRTVRRQRLTREWDLRASFQQHVQLREDLMRLRRSDFITAPSGCDCECSWRGGGPRGPWQTWSLWRPIILCKVDGRLPVGECCTAGCADLLVIQLLLKS